MKLLILVNYRNTCTGDIRYFQTLIISSALGPCVNNDETGRKEGESIAYEIVSRIAARDDVSPITLPTLYDAIDPHALQTLSSNGDVSVQFIYAGYRIRIRGGDVAIERTDGSPADDAFTES